MSAQASVIATPFSPEAFEARARDRLSPEPSIHAFDPGRIPERGDHQLAPMLAPADGNLHRPAAVLIPVVAHAGQASVLLTRRASHLRDHSGQVAFPGGKIDAADASPMAAAIREAQEEIGLASEFIRPLGYLDAYLTSTGFRVIPVVSLVRPGYTLALNAEEVDAVFETPLSFLMDPVNHERHAREWKGSLRHYYAMPYGEHYIWGATAGMLRNLYERALRRMTRAIIEELLLFLVPFALFALWLIARRKTPLARVHWDGNVSWLVLAGLAVAGVWLVVTGLTAPRGTGPYVPAHMENGRFVPGHID